MVALQLARLHMMPLRDQKSSIALESSFYCRIHPLFRGCSELQEPTRPTTSSHATIKGPIAFRPRIDRRGKPDTRSLPAGMEEVRTSVFRRCQVLIVRNPGLAVGAPLETGASSEVHGACSQARTLGQRVRWWRARRKRGGRGMTMTAVIAPPVSAQGSD
jgi:hypothetical protein